MAFYSEMTLRKSDNHFGLWLFLFTGMLVMLVILAAGMGYMKIAFGDVFRAIVNSLSGDALFFGDTGEQIRTVVVDVRLPRILTSVIVGAGLAVSGAVFQGILLNPLADPYTLGISTGAAFGASIAIILNIGAVACPIPLAAFLGAAGTLMFVIYLSSTGPSGISGLSSTNLILSGIIVSAILAAGISFLKYVADEQVSIIIFWLMGSFASATWSDVLLTCSVTSAGFLVFVFYARDLNLMSLGSRSAGTLGVNTGRITLVLLVTASLITAVAVSVSGIIGFVGLLIPHMVRFITGPDNRKLIPVSLVTGALLLLMADTVTRAVLPSEIPIGVLTALIGGPVFCWIFRRHHMNGKGVS